MDAVDSPWRFVECFLERAHFPRTVLRTGSQENVQEKIIKVSGTAVRFILQQGIWFPERVRKTVAKVLE